MYCKHCGKEISDNSLFCKYCGNKPLDENRVSIKPKASFELSIKSILITISVGIWTIVMQNFGFFPTELNIKGKVDVDNEITVSGTVDVDHVYGTVDVEF